MNGDELRRAERNDMSGRRAETKGDPRSISSYRPLSVFADAAMKLIIFDCSTIAW